MKALLAIVISSIVLTLAGVFLLPSHFWNKNPDIKTETVQAIGEVQNPDLKDYDPFPILSAQGVVVTDLDTGIVLYEKNPDGVLFPASTTKIVTALVAMDYYDNDSVLSARNINIEGQKMGLVSGEKMRAGDLLYGLLVHSANDAAETLAANYKGGRSSFIAAMNKKGEELGLKNTSFKNPTGLDEDGHYTTARDLELVSRVAMQNDLFRTIVATKEKIVKSTGGNIAHTLTNVNSLIGDVPGVLGVKTGWTINAMENLVTHMERDGRNISIVVLGSQDRFGETRELIDWVFQ